MNQQRQQAYLNLIHSLLNCPNDEEAEILNANQELIDAGLLQVMENVIQVFSEKRSEKAASSMNRLKNLANQIEENLNADVIASQKSNQRKVTEEDSKAVNFLMKILEATQYSNGSPEVVYPLLAANTNKLDNIFVEKLRHWVTIFFEQAEANTAKSIAEVIGNLGTLIAQFPLGDKANNMEIAIACYETIMQVFTREAFPQDWATTQLNLGNVYRERIKGDKTENIENAIFCYQAAFQVLIRQSSPQEWAMTQMGLGGAYSERIKENISENIETAISCYQAALQVFTSQVFPQQWAMTQINLGNAYNKRIKGNTSENIETAISCYQAALQVLTRQSSPQEWAKAHMNLGAAYVSRIEKDKAENIENAISCLQTALQIFTRQYFPQQWAMMQMNLGVAYVSRIEKDKAKNIENAISCYQSALEVLTRQAFPEEWANIQNKLGDAYWYRINRDKSDNIENAIKAYQAALEIITLQAFPQEWAKTQMNLGYAYYDRINGDKSDNIENAIKAFKASLEVCTRQGFPQQWANIQNKLGDAYWRRINGDKAENIEDAIRAFQAALEIINRQASPQDWARTQMNLGFAYINRIKGDKAENIEDAIKALQAALQVRTRQASPQDWAKTQINLGLAYTERIKGDKAENIEDAIIALQAALEVVNRQAYPQDWAIIQHNLGGAYWHRINGDKAENIENAIKAFRAALQIHSREASPQQWASTQHNLGAAYWHRINGDKAENIEDAIKAFQAALEVYTRQDFPQEWSMAQNSLGLAYTDRIKGDKADNLENAIKAFHGALLVAHNREASPFKWAATQHNLGNAYVIINKIKPREVYYIENAIEAYKAALQVRTRQAFPEYWAMTQNGLGNAYWSRRIKGDKTENIENAIEAYQAALEVYTHQAFPQQWAMTQSNLGLAYTDRVKGDKTENIENAIKAFQTALQVRTHQAFPQNHAETLFNLGILYQNIGNFNSAYTNYESAIKTVELLRGAIISGRESKRKQAEQFNEAYSRMVEVCLELDNITEAIEYVERSKTRNLVELILERDSKSIFPSDVVTRLEKYRDEIATGQYQIQNGKAENPQVLAQHLQQLRQQRDDLQNNYLPVGYSFRFDSFQANLHEHTAIIEWYVLNNKILAFIVKSPGEITVWQSQPEDREALMDCLSQYFQKYDKKDEWEHSLGEELKTLASVLHIDEILNLIPKDCNQLILIPHSFLHLFPLHALPVGDFYQDSHCLLDLFTDGISYAPSCQLLQQVQKRERPNFQSIFAIKDPTKNLAYAKLEVDSILNLFSSHQVLSDNQTSKDELLREMPKLKEANYLHFSCHGSFNFNSPQDSCLLLAESKDENNDLDLNKCLTLGNLFEQNFQLDNCRLVVLSACETGLVDFTNASDEYISLPSGFLYAGSTSVVSSLWTVNDVSTAFLMIKFLQNLQTAIIHGEDFSVAVSLSQAQKWLRNSTKTQLEDWIGEHKLNFDSTLRNQLRRRFHNIPNDSRPFESPFYWAAFCGVGL